MVYTFMRLGSAESSAAAWNAVWSAVGNALIVAGLVVLQIFADAMKHV